MDTKHNISLDSFTIEELKQIQITATQQMISIASSPSSESQIARLSQIVKKCSQATRQKHTLT